MVRFEISNALDSMNLEKKLFDVDSGIEEEFSSVSDRDSTRESSLAEVAVFFGHIAVILTAAKTLVEIFKLARADNKKTVTISLTDEDTGRKITITGENAEEISKKLSEFVESRG